MPDLLRRSLLVVLAVGAVLGVGMAGWALMTAPTDDRPESCYSDIVDTCENQRFPGEPP